MSAKIYCLDTCALTWAMRDAYHPDVVTSFWPKLETAIKSGEVVSTVMVQREIEKQDDDLTDWCKTNSGLFLPMDQATLTKASEVVAQNPKMLDPKKDKDGADPFLIAQAIVLGGIVVTQEGFSGGPHKLKIPDVCRNLDIKCINMLTMIRELKWTFS